MVTTLWPSVFSLIIDKEPRTVATEPPEVKGSAANNKKKVLTKVIGFTHENEDDIQAAIALNLLKPPKFRLVEEILTECMMQPLQKLNAQRENTEKSGEKTPIPMTGGEPMAGQLG